MGLFGRKKKDAALVQAVIDWSEKNAETEEMKRYREAQADKQYQAARSAYYELLTEIGET